MRPPALHARGYADADYVPTEYNRRVLSNTNPVLLTAHPSTPNDAVRSLEARVRADESGILVFEYSLAADLSRVRIPLPAAGERADALWRHTCFEAFVAPAGTRGYYEFNFSPTLEWAAYRFSAYRDGMWSAEIGRPPTLSLHRRNDGLDLQSTVYVERLGDLRGPLRIALDAVIEDENGGLSYWGLRHPPGKPDFHHPRGFVLELGCP